MGRVECPMNPEKLLDDETGWKDAPCKFIHPLVMGDVKCNEKQPRMGRIECPIKNVRDGNCPAQSSKYMGW